MPASEFELISRFFTNHPLRRVSQDVILDIGDDCSILACPKNYKLAVSIDTLISGVHFPVTTMPAAIAYKALAVNLSDLAAMGAIPAWFTLALTLPQADEIWLADFSSALFELANQHRISLVGGDTTRGPLSITIQIAGYVPENSYLTRSGACPGDLVCVTGTLGAAAMGLKSILEPQAFRGCDKAWLTQAKNALEKPSPRLSEGRLLNGIASAALDISDGFLADLGHILKASDCGARIQLQDIPLANCLAFLDNEERYRLALTGGDDYELCFTIPEKNLSLLHERAIQFHCVGKITEEPGIVLYKDKSVVDAGEYTGYKHF